MPNLRDLPDLADFRYRLVTRPATARLRAWDGLMECERRLAFCQWIRQGVTEDPGPNYRLLVEDFAGAFILTFEAALQSLRTQWEEESARGDFWSWLYAQPSYSLVIKGIRTIRHLYAHVEIQRGTGQTVVGIGFGSGAGERRRDFWLPEITPKKLANLKSRPLDSSQLPQWQACYGRVELNVVFEEALGDLNTIVSDAEHAHPW